MFPSLFLAHSLHFLPPLLPSINFVFFHRLSFLLSPVFLPDNSTFFTFIVPTIFHTPTAPNTFFLLPTVGQDSSGGIATRYGLHSPGIESRWGRYFPHLSRSGLGPTKPPTQWVPGLSRG
jgi:hypothetical protein